MSRGRGPGWKALCLLQYVIVRSVGIFVMLLPDEFAGYIGLLFGHITFAIDKRHRERAIDNISKSFAPEISKPEATALAKRSLVHIVTCMVETLKLPHVFSRACWQNHVDFRRFTGMEALKDNDCGIIFVTGHIGNWEASVRIMARCGFPVHSVYRTLDNPYFDRFIRKSRGAVGHPPIPRRSGLREMMRVLRRKEYLGLVIDQNTNDDPVFVDFFGRKASMVKTPAALALKTGALIVPGFAFRTGKPFKYAMYAGPPIPVENTGDREKDIEIISQKIATVFEQVIRDFPEQWLWSHNRWKTRPPGEEN